MSLLVVTVLGVCGAVNIWIESPLVRVFPDGAPTKTSAKEGRLYAARGERESFQICIRAGDKAVENVSIDGSPVGKSIPPPEVRRVGYLRVEGRSPRAIDPGPVWPDPLLEIEPFRLAPQETGDVWVTYDVPRDAPPGTYEGKVIVRDGKGRKYPVKVTIEVFAFTLPETPALRTAFPLDRKSIRTIYGCDDASLDSWKSFYDALARERMSYRLWDGGDLVRVPKDGTADAAGLKEHLEYAVNAAHMNSIDVGAGLNGIRLFPEPAAGQIQDPLQFYLHDIGNWLQDHGWLDRAYIEVTPLPDRAAWQTARDAYFRVKRNDKRFRRLLVGVEHPYFQRYAEMWAVPLGRFDPYADTALRHGDSLAQTQAFPARTVMASSCGDAFGDAAYTTRPEDGYDGSLFTFWVSKAAPTKSSPQWFQVDLQAPVTADKLKIVWRSGCEAADVEAQVSSGGPMQALSGVRWSPFPPPAPYAQSWVEGSFTFPETFSSIRLEFSSSYAGGPVGITELIFGEGTDQELSERFDPAETWLVSFENEFPSFGVDAHPVEARMFPWVCWGHDARGFIHDGLNHWPAAWAALAKDPPPVWTDGENGNAFLFYPGRTGFIPSIRSELLRDGMEDYEYLAALERAAAHKEIKAPDVLQLCARRFYACNPPDGELDAWATRILKDRVRIGRALSQVAKKEKMP
jgi:hypothetical protein